MDYAIIGNLVDTSLGVVFCIILLTFLLIINPRLRWYNIVFIISVVLLAFINFLKSLGG